MTTVIGIDASLTSLGVARLVHEYPENSSEIEWTGDTWHQTSKGTDKDSVATTCRRISYLIAGTVESSKPCDLVVMEALIPTPARAAGKAAERAALWWGIARSFVRDGIPVIKVPPKTGKLWCTGDGAADKAVVASRLTRMWDWAGEIAKEDEFDALVMASIGAQLLGLPVPFDLPKYRVDAIAGLRLPEEEAA